jgi:predicted dehydrogenase
MSDQIAIGIIGYDTSHVPAFTRLLNDPDEAYHVPGGRVVCGYASSSPDLEASYSRVDGYIRQMDEWGIPRVETIEELVQRVDAVLLESVDGRRHLAEVRPVIEAGLPVFVDKPLAADYAGAHEIVRLAQESGCPLFSSSSLRFDANVVAIRTDPDLGHVHGCDSFSPATLDATNPGLFWYGIHGVETLYTFMGTGCREVRCHSERGADVVVGVWDDERLGVMRGTRAGAHDYGATVYGASRVYQARYSREIPLYSGLVREIIRFFQSGMSPVPPEETLEIMAFMQAALVSGRENRTVGLDEVL